MTIKDFYTKYSIPINLQKHMFRVAGVGRIICQHWQGDAIDENMIIKVLLVHDLGNIIKFNFDMVELFDPIDRARINQLKQTQQEFFHKYGHDCDIATLTMMKEIGFSDKAVELCANSHGDHLDNFIYSQHWDRKIVYYADMRIGPFGVMRVNDRFADLIRRYPKEVNELKRYQSKCLEIEAELQKQVDFDLSTISNTMIANQITELQSIKF